MNISIELTDNQIDAVAWAAGDRPVGEYLREMVDGLCESYAAQCLADRADDPENAQLIRAVLSAPADKRAAIKNSAEQILSE